MRYDSDSVWPYEGKGDQLLPIAQYRRRVAAHVLLAVVLLILALGGGIWGFHATERMSWMDAYLQASMLLGGMGPTSSPVTNIGKLFAGLYAMFAGLMFIVVAGVVLGPPLHRVMHRFHIDDDAT